MLYNIYEGSPYLPSIIYKGNDVLDKKKICKKCGQLKRLEEFRKKQKYYENVCKECTKERSRINSKIYRETHKEQIKISKQLWEEKNKEKHSQQNKMWKINHKEEDRQYNKEYKQKNKERIKKQNQEYREKNKEKCRNATKLYYQNNKQKVNKKTNEYCKRKMKEDYIYKFKSQIRKMINNSFRRNGHTKNEKTEKIIGCTIDYFIEYLLQTYRANYGYEWDNKEKIDIDHIIPLATANTPEDVTKLCYYTNLQLLKHSDNLRKGSKLK